jgi:GNAT superfamily N-acetyltransferase
VTGNPLSTLHPVATTDLLGLARRLEMSEALAGVEYAATLRRTDLSDVATSLAIGGGYATFAGPVSPLTQAFGLGLHGALSPAELDRLQAFFHTRGAPSAVEVCSLADPGLGRALTARGYRIIERSSVLVSQLTQSAEAVSLPAGVEVRRAEPEEIAELAKVVTTGILDGKPDPAGLPDVLIGMFRMSTALAFVAICDGALVGGGMLTVHRRIAALCGTAVLPEARGRGIHAALIAVRLQAARNARAQSAMMVAEPGGASHRNAERAAFSVAYPRAKYVLDC